MEKLSRREFVRNSTFVLLIGSSMIPLASCDLASALTEADNILTLIAPLGDGVAAIIEIADPAIAPAVAAATTIYDAAVKAVESYLSQWSTASAAAQPGILSQALTAVQTLNQDAANLISAAQVKDATAAAEIASITGAVTSEISALLTVIPQIGALGGTTAALAKLTLHGGVNLHHLRSAKSWRSALVKHLSQPTNTPIDPIRVRLAQQLQELKLK